jgi:hypothetical protein
MANVFFVQLSYLSPLDIQSLFVPLCLFSVDFDVRAADHSVVELVVPCVLLRHLNGAKAAHRQGHSHTGRSIIFQRHNAQGEIKEVLNCSKHFFFF